MAGTANLKHKAWKVFSSYIRLKGSSGGSNVCITCGKRYPISKLTAGHFIAGRNNSILFDERNCHPQCTTCNILLYSNPTAYRRFMMKTYGEEVIKELQIKAKKEEKLLPSDFEKIYDTYKRKLEKLLKDLKFSK